MFLKGKIIFLNKVWDRSGPIAVLIVGVIIISIILIGKKIFQKLKENKKRDNTGR